MESATLFTAILTFILIRIEVRRYICEQICIFTTPLPSTNWNTIYEFYLYLQMHSSRPVIMDKDFSGTAVWWVSSLNGSMQRLWPLCAKNIWYWKRWLFTFYYYACVSRNNKSMFTKSFLVESIQYYKSLESKYKWTRLRYHIIQRCYCILTTKIEKSNIEYTNMFCFHRWSLYIYSSRHSKFTW